jgi:hypothetical protein
MATNLSGSFRAQVSMKLNSGDLALTQGQVQAIEAFSLNVTNGTGSGQADLFHNVNVPALGTSASTTFDLDAGTLEDKFGNGLTFVKVKAILLFHLASSSASSIKLGGDFITGSNIGTNNIVAGGMALYADPTGFTVTSTSADVLTVTNNDGSNTANYDIFIIGTSA